MTQHTVNDADSSLVGTWRSRGGPQPLDAALWHVVGSVLGRASFAARRGQRPPALVPDDRELIRALDAGDIRLEHVGPATRVALKRLGLTVTEGRW